MHVESSVLGALDTQANQRNAIQTSERRAELINSLARERQTRTCDRAPHERQVYRVFEEVVWGADHVMRRLEELRDAKARQMLGIATVSNKLRELEREEQWLMGRLEVLKGLLDRTMLVPEKEQRMSDYPEPIVGVNAEPFKDDDYFCGIWHVERGERVYVNPAHAVASWKSYAYRSDTESPLKCADENYDLRAHRYLEELYQSKTFECFYTNDPAGDEWDYRSPQQAAWWLAVERVPTSEWPDELQDYQVWAAGNLAAEEVPLDEWPKGLIQYAPYYAYDLNEKCTAIRQQIDQLTTLCFHLSKLESSREVLPVLAGIGTRLKEAGNLIARACADTEERGL